MPFSAHAVASSSGTPPTAKMVLTVSSLGSAAAIASANSASTRTPADCESLNR